MLLKDVVQTELGSISKCYGIPQMEDHAVIAPQRDHAVTPSQQASLYPVGSSRYPNIIKVKKAWRCTFNLLLCIHDVVIRRKGKFILISLFTVVLVGQVNSIHSY
jgi:hypothetical protein